MNELFTDDIRRKMLSYEEAAPDVDWQCLDDALDARKAKADTGRIRILWVRRFAVAAAMAAFVVGGAFFYFHNNDGVESISSNNNIASGSTDISHVDKTNEEEPQIDESAAVIAQQIAHSSGRQSVSSVVENVVSYPQNAMTEETKTDSLPSEKTNVEPRTEQREFVAKQNHQRRTSLPSTHHHDTQRLTAKLYLGNVMSGYNESAPPRGYMLAAADPVGSSDDANMLETNDQPMRASTPEETSVHHRQPVRYGVSLRYQLDNRWSLETGLTYSYLRSDITTTADSYQRVTEQRLHYIGVPLTASLSVWRTGGLGIYLSAGAMVETMVSGKAETTTRYSGDTEDKTTATLSNHPLQLSVGCAVGAEYMFSKTVGLYLEPGVNYYFDNHSSVKTIYDENPLNFNLNLGLRIDLSR